ncbi:AI-2E family transporter [Alkanindiges sp. WGS2144]|uniref:AI-2E family transporter n=1 Tax=Alkanindiges sp. WGS2144 TaxID=3366808 RepID=UPI0037511639
MQLLNPRQALIASYIIVATGLLLLIPLNLLPCFIAGFLVHELVNALTPYFERFIHGRRARLTVVAVLSIVVVSFLILSIGSLVGFIIHDVRGASAFSHRITLVLQDLQTQLAIYLPGYLPTSVEELKNQIMEWIQRNFALLQHTGKYVLHAFITMLIGMVLGAIVSLHQVRPKEQPPTFKTELINRVSTLADAFRNIVFAQLKISSINTILSGVFLVIALPIFGIHLPFAKTLVILTFILGLLPVVGNLVSNTLVFIAGLTVSLPVAVAALSYLILIHKLEYFLNAKIVGTKIEANSWEVLIAMLVFQGAFGLAGLVAAPIYYAYLKSELKKAGLI